MTRYLIPEMTCPVCGTSIDLDNDTVDVTCPGCEATLHLRDRLCPECGTYHSQPPASCSNCGLGMTARCPQCSAQNWTGDTVCQSCGARLDLIARLTAQADTTQRLQDQMKRAQAIKAKEEAASNARLARMLEEEQAEREALRRRLEAQKAQERKILTIVAVATGILVLMVIVYALILLL